MKFLFQLIRNQFGEILLMLFFLLVSNQYLNDRNNLIEADGRGYYEFLPATFIYHDLNFKYLDTLQTEYYDDEMIARDFYPRLKNGQRFDKYFIGTAVLQAPFFAVGHLYAVNSQHFVADGFSKPYQISILGAALFYAFFGLIFIRKLLNSYNVNRFWIAISQFGIVFCTSLLNYMQWEPAYSHVYSFFLILGFLYFARSYFTTENRKSLFWSIIFLGIIFLVRPVNVLILLFLPLIAENYSSFFNAIKSMFNKHIKTTIFSVVIVILLLQIQCLIWYFQTGSWMYYAYGEESFNWSDLHFIDFLFSYRKGFFLWAPWFFLVFIIGIIGHLLLKKSQRLVLFVVSFSVLIYVLSSWWAWTYGGSLGARPMIDFYPLFLVFIAPILASKIKLLKTLFLLSIPFCSVLMITQTDQYQRTIVTPDSMSQLSYWKVFMKTDPMYELYLWKEYIELKTCVNETNWEKHQVMSPEKWFILDTLEIDFPNETLLHAGQITFVSNKKSNAETIEIRLLNEEDSLLFNHYSTLLHVVDEERGSRFIDYRFLLNKRLPKKLKAVFVILTKNQTFTIDSMKIRFFTD